MEAISCLGQRRTLLCIKTVVVLNTESPALPGRPSRAGQSPGATFRERANQNLPEGKRRRGSGCERMSNIAVSPPLARTQITGCALAHRHRGQGFLADFLQARRPSFPSFANFSSFLFFRKEPSKGASFLKASVQLRAAASSDLLASASKVRKTPRPCSVFGQPFPASSSPARRAKEGHEAHREAAKRITASSALSSKCTASAEA